MQYYGLFLSVVWSFEMYDYYYICALIFQPKIGLHPIYDSCLC